MTHFLPRFALILAAAPLLSGCVAAIVPIAAGGAILGKGSSEDSKAVRQQALDPGVVPEVVVEAPSATAATPPDIAEVGPEVEPPPPSQDIAAAEQVAQSDVPTGELPAQMPKQMPVQTQAQAPVETPEQVPEQASEQIPAPTAPSPAPPLRAEVKPAKSEPARLPELGPKQPSPAPIYGPADYRAYDALYGYVESQARRDPVDSPRQSALLAAPGTLSPVRTDCSIRPPAVLIDLDNGDASFDPGMTPQANPALSQLLASLRLQGVEVFWISEVSAIKAGAVRNVLRTSGMDPVGRDGLLLMRRVEDRKQARRKELAETNCLLAIAGDTRSDFDELYSYLKDPSAAQPLESLIGAGWFLTPLPLIPLSIPSEG